VGGAAGERGSSTSSTSRPCCAATGSPTSPSSTRSRAAPGRCSPRSARSSWLGERLSVVAAAGVAGVAIGVFFIAGGPALWAKAHEPQQRERVRAGLLWGGLTGALIAGYTLIDGYAVKVLLISPILVDYVGNLLRVPFLLPAALRDRGGFATFGVPSGARRSSSPCSGRSATFSSSTRSSSRRSATSRRRARSRCCSRR
jgi:hypothetical protein